MRHHQINVHVGIGQPIQQLVIVVNLVSKDMKFSIVSETRSVEKLLKCRNINSLHLYNTWIHSQSTSL